MKPSPKDWKEARETISSKMRTLREAAMKGDREATRSWIETLRNEVDEFERACLESPVHFEPFARKSDRWPVVGSRVAAFRERSVDLLAKLHLAEDCELNFFKGKFATSDEAEIARVLWAMTALMRDGKLDAVPCGLVTRGVHYEVVAANYKKADAKARKLPRFTKGTSGRWWGAAEHLFIAHYGEDFHSHPAFQKHVSTGSRNGKKAYEIKDDIKKKMKQAFRSIAVG